MFEDQNTLQTSLSVRFRHLVGQQKQADVLSRALMTGRLAHAYLFLGPEGVGKEAAAIDFARALLCENRNGKKAAPVEIPCDSCASCIQSSGFRHPNLKILFPLPKPKDSSDESVNEEYTACLLYTSDAADE